MYHKVLSQVIWVTTVAGERAVFYTVHVNRCIKWPKDEGGFVKASGHMFHFVQFLEWTLDNHNDDNDNDYYHYDSVPCTWQYMIMEIPCLKVEWQGKIVAYLFGACQALV